MNKGVDFRVKYLFSFFILILFLFCGCETTDVGSARQGQAPLIPQDLNSLINSDGKIVQSERIDYKTGLFDKTGYYKIRYLSDGLKVVGFIVRPKDAGSKFPAIIYNRGGNREYGKITKGTLKYLSYLSSKSYVILASQYRGNDGGQGREEFGGRDVNDVLNLIKLAKSLPFVEPTKVVMLGFSRGGMMTYLAIKHDAEIEAAAVVGGVTDVGESYNEREEAMKNVIRELVGMDRSEWEKRSAYYWPEKIDVPILILHGEDDRRVKVSQAKKLADKLKEAGRAHELVVFPRGDHGLNTHRSERNQRILDWFERYLKKERLASLPKGVEKPIIPTGKLRDTPKGLMDYDIKRMIEKHNFFAKYLNELGDFPNDLVDNGDGTITDRATGLMWQKGGSSSPLYYGKAKKYVTRLNQENFSGYNNWHIPTLEELWSLMEPGVNERGQHIDSVFTHKQSKCWSGDPSPAGSYRDSVTFNWIANFAKGRIDAIGVEGYYVGNAGPERSFVRAVRTVK